MERGASTCCARATRPEPLSPRWKASSTLEKYEIRNKWAPALASMLVQAQMWVDDLAGAIATIDSMRDAPDGNVIVASVKLPGHSSLIAVLTGDLLVAEQLARQSEAAADQLQLSPSAVARAEPVLTLTEIAIENNQLERAQVEVDRLMRIVHQEYRPLIAMTGHLIHARLASATGEHSEVASHLERARRAVPKATALVVAHIDRVELRLALECGAGNIDMLLRRLPPSPESDLLAARVRLASGDDEAARSILAHAPVDATPRYRIEHGILSALALASGDIGRAHARLRDALTLAEAGGFQRSIVSEGPRLWELLESLPSGGSLGAYVTRLLGVARRVVPAQRVPNQDRLIEPLSDRETHRAALPDQPARRDRDRKRALHLGQHRALPHQGDLSQAWRHDACRGGSPRRVARSPLTNRTSGSRGGITQRVVIRDHPPRGLDETVNRTNGSNMTDTATRSINDLGPVDYIVVEFPAGASNFTGEMAEELVKLVDAGTIRVIDVLILTKNDDGSIDAMELGDVAELGAMQQLEAELAELLAEDDIVNLAAAMDPGSTAGVLIWENLWAAPFASAARRSGGQLIADGRIPIQAIIASIEADEANLTEGD